MQEHESQNDHAEDDPKGRHQPAGHTGEHDSKSSAGPDVSHHGVSSVTALWTGL
jgi:hypothetical protein